MASQKEGLHSLKSDELSRKEAFLLLASIPFIGSLLVSENY